MLPTCPRFRWSCCSPGRSSCPVHTNSDGETAPRIIPARKPFPSPGKRCAVAYFPPTSYNTCIKRVSPYTHLQLFNLSGDPFVKLFYLHTISKTIRHVAPGSESALRSARILSEVCVDPCISHCSLSTNPNQPKKQTQITQTR